MAISPTRSLFGARMLPLPLPLPLVPRWKVIAAAVRARLKMWDPGIVAAVVTGVFLLVVTLVGTRSKREETATTGLTGLIGGLQEELGRLSTRVTHLEAVVAERDTEIHKMRLENEVLTAENRRLTTENALQRAQLVVSEVAHAVAKATDWDETEAL